MITSDSIGKIAEALVKAQKSVEASVTPNAENSTFGSRYPNLGAVIQAIKPALTEVGIVVIQSPTASTPNGFVNLTTRFLHQSGEWIEDTATAPMPQLDPQGFGSGISYLRRYALSAMMGLYHGDDDDGESTKKDGIPIPDFVPKTAEPTRTYVKKTPEEKSVKESEALEKRVKAWISTISNASIERLETAKSTARGTFNGPALAEIEQAIANREDELAAITA